VNETRVKTVLTVAGVMFTLAFCLAPFATMAVVSLADRPDFMGPGGQFRGTLANYRDVLTDESLHFVRYLVNSMVVSLASAAVAVALGSLAAYAITRLPIAGKMALLFAVLTVAMFPQIGIVGYLFRLMTTLGWIDTYQALVLPYVAWALPLALWILVGYFAEIPRELDAAALVDGCSRWQILRKVILPVAVPGVLSTFLLAFIFAFNEFLFALMLTTSFRSRTVPVGIALFQGLHGQIPWGDIMAASVITTLPVVVITLLFQRRIITGLTHGAVKG
jgi:multiple sugar transport system permease protein